MLRAGTCCSRAPIISRAGEGARGRDGHARTEFGKIAHLTQSGRTPPPFCTKIRRLTRLIAVLATSLGVFFFFFVLGRSVGLSFWENFIFAIGIIVANVPEACCRR